ncbi:MAG: hypothetical protein ACRC5H_08865 [Treponemataceae bacterium]
MILDCDFDIIGHIDVIRKRNQALQFFDESASWYKKEIQSLAHLIGTTNKKVEINTGGMARKSTIDTYPSFDFLQYLYQNNVPIVLNSDAHNIENLDSYYDFAKQNAINAGYKSIFILEKKESINYWKEVDINDILI